MVLKSKLQLKKENIILPKSKISHSVRGQSIQIISMIIDLSMKKTQDYQKKLSKNSYAGKLSMIDRLNHAIRQRRELFKELLIHSQNGKVTRPFSRKRELNL